MSKWLKTALIATGAAFAAHQGLRFSRRISLSQKIVLITGGSRGLGLALAREFATHGARIALCARDAGELETAREELNQSGARVLTLVCDVTEPAQIASMIRQVTAQLGPIDVLVNNVGIISVGPLETMNVSDFEQAMAINFWAAVHTSLAVREQMKSRGGGRIVNIASVGGKMPVPHLVPYSASKFALVGFSGGARAEWLKDKIYVTTVNPGLMRTGSPARADFKSKHREEYAWFSISDAMPGLSMEASRAARKIVNATIHGDAEVMLGWPAKLAALLYGIAPGADLELASLASRWLPSAGGIGQRSAKGYESESQLIPSAIRAINERAERDYNQKPA